MKNSINIRGVQVIVILFIFISQLSLLASSSYPVLADLPEQDQVKMVVQKYFDERYAMLSTLIPSNLLMYHSFCKF